MRFRLLFRKVSLWQRLTCVTTQDRVAFVGYTYDDLDRLESVMEYGWFERTPDQSNPEYGEVKRDYTGELTVQKFDLSNSDIIFDAASKSVACMLAEDTIVSKIELCPRVTSLPVTTMHRVRERDITVYAKNNDGDAWTKVTGWKYALNGDTGVITIGFPLFLEARYVKVNTIWDDRNEANESVESVDFATFANAAPTQRRVPPPKGMWANVLGRSPMKRSGSKRSGFGNSCNRWCTCEIATTIE